MDKYILETALEQRKIRQMLGAYVTWAKESCAPVSWRNENGEMHNGTMTFVETSPGTVLGITNAHVADGIDTCTDQAGRGCQLGGAHLDPCRLIARHGTLDLASYSLSDVILPAVGQHYSASLNVWPPERPVENEAVMLGGWPGIYRKEAEGNLEFKFAWFAGKVSTASENKVGIWLDIANSKALSRDRIEEHADLGGASGGPMFRIVERNNLEYLELAAIIYEYSPTFELAFAIPLTSLAKDGTFAD